MSLFRLFSLALGLGLSAITFAENKPQLVVYTYDSFVSEWGPGPAIERAFEETCNCDLKFVNLEDGVALLTRLKLEGNGSKADVVLGLDTNLTAEARATGLFAPHENALDQLQLPNTWKDKIFLPYDYGYFAFVYNKDTLKNPPTSLKELVENPQGPKIIIQDPRTSTPGLGLLLWIKTVYGKKAKEAWEKLAPRILTVTKGWSEAYGLFLKGEAPMVLSYTTSPAYHVIAENDHRYQAAAFSDGHYQQIEVSAMLKSSKNPQLARAFLNFTQQKTFQEIIPTTNWMLPAALPKNAWPAGFDQLVVADPVLLMADEDVARQRKNWINEWLRALVK